MNKFVVGDEVLVMMPYWVQVNDGVEPIIKATVVTVSQNTVTVEYDTPDYGRQSLVVHELDRMSIERA